jgi:hypothetical protein
MRLCSWLHLTQFIANGNRILQLVCSSKEARTGSGSVGVSHNACIQTEVHVAGQAAVVLGQKGFGCSVVCMPFSARTSGAESMLQEHVCEFEKP